ncbi:hypothetical protein [Tsukamurella serpentis]
MLRGVFRRLSASCITAVFRRRRWSRRACSRCRRVRPPGVGTLCRCSGTVQLTRARSGNRRRTMLLGSTR